MGQEWLKKLVLKFEEEVNLENIVFISISVNNLTLSLFCSCFNFCSDIHNYETSCSSHVNLQKLSYRTKIYGKSSVI